MSNNEVGSGAQGRTDFDRFIKDSQSILDRCVQIMSAKSHDYAESKDAFINFKTAAQLAGISPEQTLLTLLGMKLSRLTQLVGKGKQPKNEALEDTMVDVINYTLLLRGMIKERTGQSEPIREVMKEPASIAPPSPAPTPMNRPSNPETGTNTFTPPNLLPHNSF